jgi:hypothetical protein
VKRFDIGTAGISGDIVAEMTVERDRSGHWSVYLSKRFGHLVWCHRLRWHGSARGGTATTGNREGHHGDPG